MRSPSQQSRPILHPKSLRRTSSLHRPTTVEITMEPCSYDTQVVRNTDSEYPLSDATTPPSIRHYIENLPYSSDPPLIEPMAEKKVRTFKQATAGLQILRCIANLAVGARSSLTRQTPC